MNLIESYAIYEPYVPYTPSLKFHGNIPIDILLHILSYDGRWRYDTERKQFISMLDPFDIRYVILDNLFWIREQYGYDSHFLSSSGLHTIRTGCIIPISSLVHLPNIMDYNRMKNTAFDANVHSENMKNCMRYLHVEHIIRDVGDEITSAFNVVRSRVSKYDHYKDSSDSDIDEDEYRSYHDYRVI